MTTQQAPSGSAGDPQYRAYQLKRTVARQGPGAVDGAELLAVAGRLPGDEASALLSFLAASGTPESRALLAGVARSDARTEVRNRALVLLAGSAEGREGYVDLFREILSGGPGDFVAATAVKALGQGGDGETFGTFKSFLTHRDARVRANCVEGLRFRSVPGLRPVLELLLDDPSPRVRAEAALSLWKLGNPVLLQLLADAEDPAERLSYLRALGRTGRDERVMALLWEIFGGPDAAESAAAAGSLLQLDPDAVVPRMVAQAVFGGLEFRGCIFSRCIEHDRDRTVAELTRHVRDLSSSGPAHTRALATALALLKETGEVGDVDAVAALLDHDDSRVASNAIEVLSPRTAAPGIRAALIRCLRTGTPRMRVNAAVALWRAGLVGAVSELRAMLDDDDPCVRSGGCWGLGTVGGLVGGSFLEGMLSDPDERVRKMAARFLS